METNETIINGSVPNQVPEMNPVPQKKGKGAWKAVVAVVLTAGVVGSTTLSAFNLATLKSYIATQNEDQNEETTEDYVTIAEQYEIKPTTNISDAYKSGDTSKLTDREKETLDMAKDALKEMKIKDGMSDFEKEKAVYDWMTSSLQYDSGALTVIPSTQEDCDNPYGVLKYHNAVCVGYATTFRMFMQMMDIECMVEHNTEKYHSWDLVKIDGDWYITDIYSDQTDDKSFKQQQKDHFRSLPQFEELEDTDVISSDVDVKYHKKAADFTQWECMTKADYFSQGMSISQDITFTLKFEGGKWKIISAE